VPSPADTDITHLLFTEQNKEKAFALLLSRHKKDVYFVVRRLVLTHENADDVTQEVFIKVWKNLNTFRAEASLKTWLYKIASNEALMLLRKKKRAARFRFVSIESLLMESLKADTYFDGDEAESKLHEALLHLPEKQRLVFQLKYFEELSYKEIAEITSTTVGSLKASYHHAKEKIERQLNLSF